MTGGSLAPQGPVARAMADLWWLMLGLGTAVFLVFLVVLVVALVRGGPGTDPRSEPQDPRGFGRWLVLGGVLGPLVVLMVVFGATVQAMRGVPDTAPAGALVVDIVGHQWRYEVTYPAEGISTTNELHLPVGRLVALRLTSADVIHSVWVPALAGKMDLLPDRTNTLVLQADEPGEHATQCAEFCGLQHANMRLRVVAQSPEEFQVWVDERQRAAAHLGGAK